eukprot:6188862-Pleurochrysis_carterae.AAC.1
MARGCTKANSLFAANIGYSLLGGGALARANFLTPNFCASATVRGGGGRIKCKSTVATPFDPRFFGFSLSA